ncbi:MAG: TMEM175 family protein [Bacteroidota bacterium]
MKTFLSGDKSSRMDAFSDGVFSIVATLLVLDVKIPAIPEHHTNAELLESLKHALPSFVAFTFSFLTVIIYWINHDHISHWIKYYTPRMKYINLFFLFWICLIPFPTKFISEYPGEQIAVTIYGIVFIMLAMAATMLFWYIAFYTDSLNNGISVNSRKKYLYKIIGGPILYAIAIWMSFVNVKVSIALYIIIPLLYVVLPKAELVKEQE